MDNLPNQGSMFLTEYIVALLYASLSPPLQASDAISVVVLYSERAGCIHLLVEKRSKGILH